MKKIISIILLSLAFILLFSGCISTKAGPSSQTTSIANPWSDWPSIEEAEAAVGFSFGLPELIGQFRAEKFRTLNNELIEIIYSDGDCEVRVRKHSGEEQDISGDYNTYEKFEESRINGAKVSTYYNSSGGAVKQTISHQGYSWSLVASEGYSGDSNIDFINEICK